MHTHFTQLLLEANGIDPASFRTWVFCEQMTFNAPGKWWGDHGPRDFPHEGIDVCMYADPSGQLHRLDHTIQIPAMHDGRVKALFNDYLGQAVIIAHESGPADEGPYLSAYAHTVPRPHILPGAEIRRGDIIAAIADTRQSEARILPHLHYSLGRPSPKLAYDNFVWNLMRDPDRVTLLDPMALLDGPKKVLSARDRCCRDL